MLTTDELTARLSVAQMAARRAGEVLLGYYRDRDALAVEQKSTNDYVSNADREAEAVIADLVLGQFPLDGFLGEETGTGGAVDSSAVWCVDPLDGTTNFLKGAHNWCVSIGLFADDRPVLGVIHDPLRDETFVAAEGLGALCNGAPMRVSTTSELSRATLGLGHNARIPVPAFAEDVVALLTAGAGFTQVGAAALMLAYVADGRVDAYVERHLWPWDAVAGLALIREAGGSVSRYPATGGLASGGPVIAGAPTLRSAIGQLVRLDG